MSTYYYGPALDSELAYRRAALQHDAAADRLARDARLSARATRFARRFVAGHRSPVAVVPDSPVTAAERPATRAA